jgi:serine protein kinase
MDLRTRLEAFRLDGHRLNWEGTFADYFDQVVKRPQAERLAHARIYDMIMAAGVEAGPRGEKRHGFFRDESFGPDDTLE